MSIPYESFSNRGPILHFAHANVYPPACYRGLLDILANDFRVIAMCQRPLWPGSRPEEAGNVHVFVDDLIRFFDQEGIRDAVGVGHSLGGVVTMFAALRRPELFKSLVLIEPTFLPPSLLDSVLSDPPAITVDEIPIIKAARKRRNGWESRQAAFDHFRVKDVFDGWTDRTLWDYVEHGFREDEQGQVVMIFSPEWEAHIYTLMLFDIWQYVSQIAHPTLGLRGPASDTLFPESWELWQQVQPEAHLIEIPDTGHLLPMEQPGRVAQEILRFTGVV